MLRLSIQARQALARLTLPVLIVASVALMIVGRAAPVAGERARAGFADRLAPLYAVLAAPLDAMRDGARFVADLASLRSENARLRDENTRLRRWYDVAMALDAENATLKANLNWIPDPAPRFVTARVVADAGGVYARSVLISTGPNHAVRKGQIALDERGLVGRVTEVGARSARVLLLTDMNSRVPVMLEGSQAQAILAGGAGPAPKLLYLPAGARPEEGARVVTSSEANAFPAGLPVGTVHWSGTGGVPEVVPAARLDRLQIVRVFEYGMESIAPPEAPGRVVKK